MLGVQASRRPAAKSGELLAIFVACRRRMTPDFYAPLPSYRVTCQHGGECYLAAGCVYRSFPEAFLHKSAHEAREGHTVSVEQVADE